MKRGETSTINSSAYPTYGKEGKEKRSEGRKHRRVDLCSGQEDTRLKLK